MAKLVGIKLPKPKKEKKISTSVLEEKHVGSEPKWDTERAKKFEKDVFEHNLRASFRYYNYFYSQKDLKKHVVTWAQKNMDLDAKTLSLYIASSAEATPMTVCSLVKAEAVGMPMLKKYKEYITKSILNAIEETKSEPAVVEKVVAKTVAPTIQDRLAEKTSEIIGDLEVEVDNAFLKKPTGSPYDIITAKNLAHAQVGKVREHFQKQIDELSELVAGQDEQLNESYGFLKNSDIKRIGAFYVKLLADLDSYSTAKKATKKLKIKRPQNKDKLVAKVQYLKESKVLKLVSVPPADIIGAQELWVYHTKHKKLGKYVADDDHSVLGVKGTTLTGFSESKSMQKTLRKPEEQLAAFMKAGKVQLRTFLKDIKAVETKLTGRLNADTLLLKIEK